MQSRKSGIVAAFAMALFAACFSPAAVHAKDVDLQLKPLQGTWKVVELYKDGKKRTGDDVKDVKIVINGDKLSVPFFPGMKLEEAGLPDYFIPWEEAPISVDQLKGTMDIHSGGHTVLALYSWNDGSLTICFNKSPDAPRPEHFGVDNDRTMIVLTLETK